MILFISICTYAAKEEGQVLKYKGGYSEAILNLHPTTMSKALKRAESEN